MAPKLIYLFVIMILLQICKSRAQVSITCSKKDKAVVLLDTANDFITRARDSTPTYFYDVNQFMRSKKSSSLLSAATNLISSAKKTYDTGSKASKYKVVCAFSNWGHHYSGDGQFEVSHVDPNLCTHILYYQAKIHNNQMTAADPSVDLDGPGNMGGFKMINALKRKNPNLKTLLLISESKTGPDQFSNVTSDQTNRTTFVDSVVPFLRKHGFDGVHVNWPYPKEKQLFCKLLQDLKATLNPQGLLLSAYAPYGKYWIDNGYDIPAVFKELDLVHLLTYNYAHGKSETFMNAPLYSSEDDVFKELTVNFTVNYWLEGGALKEKLILGLGLLGASFTLADTTQHGLHAAVTGKGQKGSLLGYSGRLGYNEVCINLTKKRWNSVYDWESRCPYAYKGDQWVSYDDIYSLNIKIDYMIEKSLAGVSLSIDNDDFRGNCYGKKYPLLTQVASRLLTGCQEKVSSRK